MSHLSADQNFSYDTLAKRFLSRKSILAFILKNAVPEFADCSLSDIEKKYIEGEPYLSINTVPLDDILDIKGRNTESNSPNEGLVTFDIIFDAFAPSRGELVKLIIHIEPQRTTSSIPYKLMKRAVYYAARLISSQKEKEFHGDNYNDIKKIFSIWICMDVQNYRADSIQEYRLREEVIHGNFHDDLCNYDLISVIVLNLGKKQTTHELLNLLHLLFMEIKPAEEKLKILQENYQIEVDYNMKEELKNMEGLMEPLLNIAAEQAAEKATAETERKTLLDNIRSLMKKLNMTAQQAMDVLDIPADKQKEFNILLRLG